MRKVNNWHKYRDKFAAITFMLNGYGDIVPQTHCGRVVAITVGVVVSYFLSKEATFDLGKFISFRSFFSKIISLLKYEFPRKNF